MTSFDRAMKGLNDAVKGLEETLKMAETLVDSLGCAGGFAEAQIER